MAIANVDLMWAPAKQAGTSVEVDPIRHADSAVAAIVRFVDGPTNEAHFKARSEQYRRIPKLPAEDYSSDDELF